MGSDDGDALERLPSGARRAVARARAKPLSYVVKVLETPGAPARTLVVLGEAHMKLDAAADIGRAVVQSFPLRGVESFPVKRVLFGQALWIFVHGPRLVVRALSLGAVKGSTITEAKALPTGHTALLEEAAEIPVALHVGAAYLSLFFGAFFALLFFQAVGTPPAWLTLVVLALEAHLLLLVPAWMLRRRPWAWAVHPFMAILATRDVLMARGTVHMFATHPGDDPAVIVMGRAHVTGTCRELVSTHGFRERG
jgi:hypothetical protein